MHKGRDISYTIITTYCTRKDPYNHHSLFTIYFLRQTHHESSDNNDDGDRYRYNSNIIVITILIFLLLLCIISQITERKIQYPFSFSFVFIQQKRDFPTLLPT